MHITLKFDKNSVYWEKEYEFNKLFVRSQQMYIQDLYKMKGYIYLSTIYMTCLVLCGIHTKKTLQRKHLLDIRTRWGTRTINSFTRQFLQWH